MISFFTAAEFAQMALALALDVCVFKLHIAHKMVESYVTLSILKRNDILDCTKQRAL